MSVDRRFFDLDRLRSLRAALRDLEPTRPPALRVIRAPAGPPPRRRALLPGSFNPPTDAHLALAAAARGSGRIDALDYLLASRTINKERVEGAALADRLLLLDEIAREWEGEGVVLVNRGLYVEQAQIARAAWPELRELWFVVGYDKLVQIFDPHYYADYRAALDRLFALASLLVAPRAADGPDQIRALLDKPENRRYADGVVELSLAAAYRNESSTRARLQIARGGRADDVPPIVDAFVAATGAYRAPPDGSGPGIDRYAWRERLLDLFDEPGAPAPSPGQLAALLDLLTDPGASGRRARAVAGPGRAADLLEILPPEHPT